jgi:hypothetical protein
MLNLHLLLRDVLSAMATIAKRISAVYGDGSIILGLLGGSMSDRR